MAPKASGAPMEPKIAAPAPGEVRLYRTDIPKASRKSVANAAHMMYKRIVEGTGGTKEENQATKKRPKMERWRDYAQALQGSLDRSLGQQWHVIMGENLGFACKKRNQTMIVLRVDKIMIVCWRSPGIEEPEDTDNAAENSPATEAAENSPATEDANSKPPKGFRVIEPARYDEAEEGSQVERCLAVLRRSVRSRAEAAPGSSSELGDVQEVAQEIRRQLTAELGTIWHVVVGIEFVTATACNRRNFCRVAVNKSEIVCFMHEQFEGTRIDHERIIKSIPYLLLVVFCFGYMTLSSVCGEEAPPPEREFANMMRRRFCKPDWESDLQMVGAAALLLLFVTKKMHVFLPARMGGKPKID